SANGTVGIMVNLGAFPGTAFGINDLGQVVGSGANQSNGGFIWTPATPHGVVGTFATLSGPGYGINVGGQVCFAGSIHAQLFTPTTPNGTTGLTTDLGDLPGGSDFSSPSGINSFGEVSITSSDATGNIHAALWVPNSPNATTGSLFNLGDLPGGLDLSIAF